MKVELPVSTNYSTKGYRMFESKFPHIRLLYLMGKSLDRSPGVAMRGLNVVAKIKSLPGIEPRPYSLQPVILLKKKKLSRLVFNLWV
jgi:hypothetical protein